MSRIFRQIATSAPGRSFQEKTWPFPQRSGVKYASRYRPMNRPSRSPRSRSRYSANRSIYPLGDGVPVRPTIRFTSGRTFIRARKRFACQFLNDDSSSTTTISQQNGTPDCSTSQGTFSRLIMVICAPAMSAARRSSGEPTATDQLIPQR